MEEIGVRIRLEINTRVRVMADVLELITPDLVLGVRKGGSWIVKMIMFFEYLLRGILYTCAEKVLLL